MRIRVQLNKVKVLSVAALVVASFCSASSSHAAVFYTETFTGGLNGWVDRDLGKMSVGSSIGFGNPDDSMRGSFASQGFPIPQVDAFRATAAASGGAFAGDYYSGAPGFTGFKLDFFASNVLPSAVSVRIGNGTNTFSFAVAPQIITVGSWYTVGVPLTFQQGWFGGTATQFSNVLSGVTFVDIEINRNGQNGQVYFVDNFRLVNELIFVPEPTSGLFWFGWALVFGGLRRKLTSRKNRSPYALPATT